jgi:hypothetical protein
MTTMLRLTILMWILAGTVLAGCLVTVVVTVPSLYDAGMKYIPIAGVGGYLLAIPLAWILARKILEATRPVA